MLCFWLQYHLNTIKNAYKLTIDLSCLLLTNKELPEEIKEYIKDNQSDTQARRFLVGPSIFNNQSSYVEHALKLLKTNSYKQGEDVTGVSKSTLIRAKRKTQ